MRRTKLSELSIGIESKVIGKSGRYYIMSKSPNGVYLGTYEYPDLKILLPNNQVPKGAEKGDILEAYIYKDSEDRLIATLERPMIEMNKIATLRVKDVTKIGAFLEWGLAKDLFLPFKEQTYRVKPGDDVIVKLYVDKSARLCATMKIYNDLGKKVDAKVGDRVKGRIYEITESYGVFVAVEDKYSALIPHNEMTKDIIPGKVYEFRVKEVRDGGKMALSMREKAVVQMGMDSEMILAKLEAAGGFLPFHDKTPPAIIKREFSLSKNAFKRAIGRLLKEKKIIIKEDGIELIR
ncbi:MAG: S1 RNA-binding domain-containing protein [Eubacterium sp.]|nr:S1 RNA-binding domain-containing protein [Eubacterium sp.]